MRKIVGVLLVSLLLMGVLSCDGGPQNLPSLENMVLVEGGSFMMGREDGEEDQKPVHKVNITRDYYIGKYEVTFDEYILFCEDTEAEIPSDEGPNGEFMGKGKNPVVNVTHNNALEYCNWLSKKEGLTPCYRRDKAGWHYDVNANGYRLPTEAEWEFAARGGNKSEGFIYSGSNDVNEVAWNVLNSGDKVLEPGTDPEIMKNNNPKYQEVGSKKPNELGLYDMTGNVWEWCWDQYGIYKEIEETNPLGDINVKQVLRGGSWYNLPEYVTAFHRAEGLPIAKNFSVGFRIAKTK